MGIEYTPSVTFQGVGLPHFKNLTHLRKEHEAGIMLHLGAGFMPPSTRRRASANSLQTRG